MARWVFRAGAVAAALLLSACDFGRIEAEFVDLPPGEIVAQALAAMESVESLTMSGTGFIDGDIAKYEATYGPDSSCDGTIRVDNGEAHVIVLDGDGFVRGNRAYWRTAGDELDQRTLDLLSGNWVAVPPVESFLAVCDFDKLLEAFEETLEEDLELEKFSKLPQADMDGRAAVEVGLQDETGSYRIWVATEGTHHLLGFSNRVHGLADSLFFSDFNEPVEIKAPPADEIIDRSGAAVT